VTTEDSDSPLDPPPTQPWQLPESDILGDIRDAMTQWEHTQQLPLTYAQLTELVETAQHVPRREFRCGQAVLDALRSATPAETLQVQVDGGLASMPIHLDEDMPSDYYEFWEDGRVTDRGFISG
jgi:hypothetical protein